MDLDQLHELVERFRRATIGPAVFLPEKQAHEYADKSIKTVVVLKLIRATHALTAMYVLVEQGLLIDAGSAGRSIYEALAEVDFLLEEYPNHSSTVDQFVKHFFQGTTDGHKKRTVNPVPMQKVRAAAVRLIEKRQDHKMQQDMLSIYDGFSGYTHGGYAHTMEVYFGQEDNFCLTGVHHVEPYERWMVNVTEAAHAVLLGIGVAAHILGISAFETEAIQMSDAWEVAAGG